MEKNYKYFLIFIVLVFLLMRIPGLGYDMSNSDAVRWHRRSENFLQALKSHDYKNTYQHYQPGVTLMWTNAVVKHIAYKISSDDKKQVNTLENAGWFPVIDFYSRGFVVFILGGMLVVQVYLIKNIYNITTSLIYGLFMSVEPYLVGIDRWFHVTSLETYFGFLGILLLLYWRKNGKLKYLCFSALSIGAAVMSKLAAIIVLPLFIGVVIFSGNSPKKTLKYTLLFISVFIFFIVIILPALWATPLYVISRLYKAASSAVFINSGSTFIGWYYYFILLVFKLSPITLLLFLISVIYFLKNFMGKKLSFNVVISVLYFLSYFVSLSYSSQKIDRYVLPMIPPIILIISIFLSRIRTKIILFVLLSIFLFTFWLVKTYHPVYSAYYSPIFGGSEKALELSVYDNSGEYFAQTAFYLNKKGRNIKTYVPNNIDSFVFYYKGKLSGSYDDKPDYVVMSQDFDRKIELNQVCPVVEKTFGPANFKAVYIFRCTR